MADKVEQEIIALIADIAGVEESEITPDTSFQKDLDIDSIRTIEITVAIEKKFKVSVRDEDVPKITTVRQAVELVNRLLPQTV